MSHEDAARSFAFDLLRATPGRYTLGFSPFRTRICGCTRLHIYTDVCVYAYDWD
jgi:hypothetical protein